MKILIIADIPGWAMNRVAMMVEHACRGEDTVTIYAELNREYRVHDYDVVYATLPCYLPALHAPSSQRKLRTTFHGGPFVESQAQELQDVYGDALKNIRMSVPDSQTEARLRAIGFPYPLERTPYGVDTKHFDPPGARLEREQFICGYAGWATFLMGVQERQRRGSWIMAAREKLLFSLKVAGGLPGFWQIMAFKMVHPAIFCKSYGYSALPAFYSGIDLYLVPDFQAGGPLPMLEAAACGVPSVYTPCGTCGDLLVDGIHGLMALNQEEFEAAIFKLQLDRDALNELGANARMLVAEKRNLNAVASHWRRFIYEQTD